MTASIVLLLSDRIPAAGCEFAVRHPQTSQVGDDHWFPVVSSIQTFCAVLLDTGRQEPWQLNFMIK
jgi:hypothetical protein